MSIHAIPRTPCDVLYEVPMLTGLVGACILILRPIHVFRSRSQPPPPPMMTHHSGEQSQSHMGALSVVLNDQATTQWEQDRARILNELDRCGRWVWSPLV